MNEWNSGYVTDTGYIYGYYSNLNPLNARLAFLNAGLMPPNVLNACELGFGQGVSINIHAAGSQNIRWQGNDFNPTQANFARNLSHNCGNNAHFSDESFSEICARTDLPKFQFIAFHGIWSWISEENRKYVLDFINKNLDIGGVVYISYNTFPGWSTNAPLRHLLAEYSKYQIAPSQDSASKIETSVGFAQSVFNTEPSYILANPRVKDKLEFIQTQNRQYLAHEYINQDWQPFYFSELAASLESVKLTFGCSANYLDHIPIINLTETQEKFLNKLSNRNLRESIRDFMVNQEFRKDYWVKGAVKIGIVQKRELLRSERIVLTSSIKDVALKAIGSLGEATLHEAVYLPLLNLISDNLIHNVGELESSLCSLGISLDQIFEAILILVGMGYVSSAKADKDIDPSIEICKSLNTEIALKAKYSGDINVFACPVTGGGIVVPRFFQLFWLAMQEGVSKPEALAGFVWEILSAQEQSILKDGKVLTTPKENLDVLCSDAKVYLESQLPVLKALQMV